MLVQREPVLIASLIRASIVLAAAFGLALSAAQTGALVLFAEAVLSVLVRSAVTSPATTAVGTQMPAAAGS